ncbi:MAG: hypothetical protein KDC07_05890, partial [Chitinophagaceae bacterium]|nr:hypothetical protein [Chitinophagaceae bacterium]
FFRSIDKGATWQTKYMDTNLVKNLVDVVFLSPDTGFISGARGHESIVLKTIDGGANWVKVFGDTTIGGKIWKLQFLDNRIAYASIEPLFSHDTVNMIYSYDGGDNWTIVHVGKIATKPGGWGTQGVGFVKAAKGWVGGYFDGIFETTDSGKTWNHISFGYDFNRIFVIDSNHVFAGGHSVYKYGSGIFTGVKETGISNPPHILYPVSPNPTKGNVKIEFDLKRSTNVVLDVVSMDSRHIFPVTNVFLNPGHYTYYWNDIEAQPGNYIIWLGTNEIPIVQKFVLLE